MTAASRKPSRRYSRESQQEDRSEAQIKERFADPSVGWPCERLGRDLGEDLHVRIYDEGQSTGLDFYVQLKSAANAERLRRKGEDPPTFSILRERFGRTPYEARDATAFLLAVASPAAVIRADAGAAGASDTIFEALLAERKIEPVASGVYRLVHFPRSDHEELITLWLPTDRRGVVSHDSALLLHELSDVLPARRHVTIPPGWDPGDRKLDADIDLHRAEIAEHEVRWIGPVPYTAPLRTVRDCIDNGLSPDLLEQAIAQGVRRRFFRVDDLPPPCVRGRREGSPVCHRA